MKIHDLLVTQDGFRKPHLLVEMLQYVRSGGLYSQQRITDHSGKDSPPLIRLVRFEDGLTYIHDGHHRIASIHLSGTRNELHEDEYQIQDVTYDYYTDIGLEVGWVTPFDPRTHVRLPNFCPFKKQVLAIEDREAAHQFIRDNGHLYLVPRTYRHAHVGGILPDEILREHRNCWYCGLKRTVPLESHLCNRFCDVCLPERVALAAAEAGPIDGFRMVGHYMEVVRKKVAS